MVWGEAFDAALQLVPVVYITGYNGLYVIIKLCLTFHFKLNGLIKMENIPNSCQGLSILIRMEEELDSWMLGMGCVE